MFENQEGSRLPLVDARRVRDAKGVLMQVQMPQLLQEAHVHGLGLVRRFQESDGRVTYTVGANGTDSVGVGRRHPVRSVEEGIEVSIGRGTRIRINPI